MKLSPQYRSLFSLLIIYSAIQDVPWDSRTEWQGTCLIVIFVTLPCNTTTCFPCLQTEGILYVGQEKYLEWYRQYFRAHYASQGII